MTTKICVIGLGYIGLPTAVIFALHGAEVLGVDINPRVVESIRQGKMHFIEPDMDAVLAQVVLNKQLQVSDKVAAANVFIIAVPTPFKENFKPDISYVEAAFSSIAPVLKKGDLVILESTSPVGTTEKMAQLLASLRSDLTFPLNGNKDADVNICYCPERVLPGRVLHELVHNDRVIGGLTEACTEKACATYKIFLKGECLRSNAKTAEMTKLTENAFRDVNIAFANELSMVCDEFDINVWELIKLANHHPRVNILRPGAGVGGHCIAVDPWFIISESKQAHLMKTARLVNNHKPEFIIEKVKAASAAVENAKIACLGLAYKKDIDDLRESPAVEIVHHLAEQNFDLTVVEPHVEELPTLLKQHVHIQLNNDLEKVIEQSDVILLLVDHTVFSTLKTLDLSKKKIIDACGVFAF